MNTTTLVEHLFRHEYGRLVAILSRRVGVQHIEAVEDAVQSALMKALESWTITGLPDNPSAWLFRFRAPRSARSASFRLSRENVVAVEAFAVGITEDLRFTLDLGFPVLLGNH